MTRNPLPPEPPGDWVRLDTREQFAAQIERDKIETMHALHAWALRIALDEFPDNVTAAVAAIIAKAWPLAEAQIDAQAALIRKQIAPTLAPVASERYSGIGRRMARRRDPRVRCGELIIAEKEAGALAKHGGARKGSRSQSRP